MQREGWGGRGCGSGERAARRGGAGGRLRTPASGSPAEPTMETLCSFWAEMRCGEHTPAMGVQGWYPGYLPASHPQLSDSHRSQTRIRKGPLRSGEGAGVKASSRAGLRRLAEMGGGPSEPPPPMGANALAKCCVASGRASPACSVGWILSQQVRSTGVMQGGQGAGFSPQTTSLPSREGAILRPPHPTVWRSQGTPAGAWDGQSVFATLA